MTKQYVHGMSMGQDRRCQYYLMYTPGTPGDDTPVGLSRNTIKMKQLQTFVDFVHMIMRLYGRMDGQGKRILGILYESRGNTVRRAVHRLPVEVFCHI